MRPKAGRTKKMQLSVVPPSNDLIALLGGLAPSHYGKGDRDGWIAKHIGVTAEKIRKVRGGRRRLTEDEYRALISACVEQSEKMERRLAAVRENTERLAEILKQSRAGG